MIDLIWITLFIVSVIVLAVVTSSPHGESKKETVRYSSAMDKYVRRQEEMRIEAQKQKEKEYLNLKIQKKIDEQKSYYTKTIYQSVLDLPDEKDIDFEYKEWLFNYGNLRTDKEIEDWKYRNGGFEKDLEKPKWYILVWVLLCFLIPFVWLLSGYGFEYLQWLEVWILFFLLLVFTSFIPITIYCCSTTSKLKKARKHGVSPRDPKFVDASVKAGIAAAGAASTLHASSKGIKNLTK